MSTFGEHPAFLFPLSLRPPELVIEECIDHERYRTLTAYYERELLLRANTSEVVDAGESIASVSSSSNASVGHRRRRSGHEFTDLEKLRMAFRDHRLQPNVDDNTQMWTCERRYRQIATRNDRRYLCDQVQNLRRAVRDYLFRYSSHLDIVCCHYSLVIGFVRRMYPNEVQRFVFIEDYLANRARYLNDLRLFTADRCSLDDCKRLVTSFLMGGSLTSWAMRLPCAYDSIPVPIRNLHSCVADLRSFLLSKPELAHFRPASYSRMDPFECTNTTLYLLLTTLESQHIIVLRRVLEEDLGIPVRAIIHDAIEVDGQYVGSEVDRTSDFLVSLRTRLRDVGFYDEVKLAFKDKSMSEREIEDLFREQLQVVERERGPLPRPPPLSLVLSDAPKHCLNPTYLKIKRRLECDFGLCRVLTKFYMKTPDVEGFLSYPSAGYDAKEMKILLDNYRVMVNEKTNESFFAIWTKDPDMQTFSHAVLYPSAQCPIPNALNLWKGFAVERFVVTDDDRKDAALVDLKEHFFRHLRYLVDDDQHAAYWMMFLAHMFQHPDEKPGVCMVLQSDTEGVGKGLFESTLRAMVGDKLSWYTNTPNEDLFGSFQDIMYHRIFGVIDESNVTMSKSVEKFKALITNESVSLTRKYHGAETTRDFHRIIITTNQTMPSVVSATDRRFMMSRSKNSAIEPDSINKLVLIKESRAAMRLIYEDLMRMQIPAGYKFSTMRPTSEFYKEIQTLSRPTTVLFLDAWLSDRVTLALNASPATSANFVPPANSVVQVPAMRYLQKLPRPSPVRVTHKELYEAYTEYIKAQGFKAECTLSSNRFAVDMRNHLGASMEAADFDHGVWYHKCVKRDEPQYYQKHVWDMELTQLLPYLIAKGLLRATEYESML